MSRRRSDRKQITALVDAGLAAAVREIAIVRGMTLTALIEGALEVCVDDYRGVGSAGGGGVVEEGRRVGQVGVGGGGSGVVADSRGRVNWDQILAQGGKTVYRDSADPYRVDPIEDIA